MCDRLILQTELFQQHLLAAFCELAKDRIVNVRIAVARVASRHLAEKGNKHC